MVNRFIDQDPSPPFYGPARLLGGINSQWILPGWFHIVFLPPLPIGQILVLGAGVSGRLVGGGRSLRRVFGSFISTSARPPQDGIVAEEVLKAKMMGLIKEAVGMPQVEFNGDAVTLPHTWVHICT